MSASHIVHQDDAFHASDDVVGRRFQRAATLLAKEPKRGTFCWQTHAPGRLDVMGGIAEYTGAVVLGLTTHEGVTITVQPRDDEKVAIYGRGRFALSEDDALVADLHAFDAEQHPHRVQGIAEWLDQPERPWLSAVGGAIHAMHAAGKLRETREGVTIVVDSEVPPLVDVGYRAAVSVPVLMGLSEAWGLRFDPLECAQLALVAQNTIGRCPCGVGAAVCVLRGRASGPVEVNCRNHAVTPLDLPDGVTLVGIDCGFKHPDARIKYAKARTAAFMGQAFIEATLSARGLDREYWNGSLSGISIKDYVGFLRDRIPTRIKGEHFREKFNRCIDPLTEIDPDAMYRVRSRTEHHIYESDRVIKFAGCLRRARQTGNRQELVDAGKEMLASHWSYGQRCGLGSVPTDALVKLLRGQEEAGIYGAKVSGHGAGGTIVVLMEEHETARTALREAIARYEAKYSKQTTMFEGGTDGALHYGVRQCEIPAD